MIHTPALGVPRTLSKMPVLKTPPAKKIMKPQKDTGNLASVYFSPYSPFGLL